MNRILFVIIGLLYFGTTAADEYNNPHEGQFYIAPGAVIYEGPDASSLGYEDTNAGPGLILGYGISDHWSVEVLVGQVESDFENAFGKSEDDITLKWVDVVYNIGAYRAWQPFLLFGAGRTDFDFDGVRPDSQDNQFNVGAGVYRQLTDRISLRGDLRGVTSSKTGGVEPFAFIGITGYLGAAKAPPPPPDSDGDGVNNDQDRCPTTPMGRKVDGQGCELDTDGDGVVDSADQCPDTPKGAAVDAKGCPLDSDGDGVPDYRDACPDSDAGAKVDDKGCYVELEEEVTIDLNLEFDTNKADIRSEHGAAINRVVKFLSQYPTAYAVIEGHTDSDGAATHNQGLSERRAKAVYDYLVETGGIDASRLTSVGYGESKPIADNDTAAGKQRNRRVSAVISGTQKVRQ